MVSETTGDSPPLHSPHSLLALLSMDGSECGWRLVATGRSLPVGGRQGAPPPASPPGKVPGKVILLIGWLP